MVSLLKVVAGESLGVKEAEAERGPQRAGHRDSRRSGENVSVASAVTSCKLAISATYKFSHFLNEANFIQGNFNVLQFSPL